MKRKGALGGTVPAATRIADRGLDSLRGSGDGEAVARCRFCPEPTAAEGPRGAPEKGSARFKVRRACFGVGNGQPLPALSMSNSVLPLYRLPAGGWKEGIRSSPAS